jgi:hypothetical protein
MSTREMSMGKMIQTFQEDGSTMSTQDTAMVNMLQTVREDDDFDVDIRVNIKPAEATESAASPFCTATCYESCGITCSCIDC